MTIRTRLAMTIVASIAITAALFATASIVAIDRALRSSFDSRLLTTARAIEAAADVHDGRIEIDVGDLHALDTAGSATPFSISDARGRYVAGALPPDPRRVRGVRTIAIPIERDGTIAGTVTVWQPNLWIDDFDRDAAMISIAIGLLLILGGIALARRAVRTALAPLEPIARLAERIEGRELSQRLDADGDDELGRLCASFDRMLDRLQAAFERERRFVTDASHEFRAPLAVLRAEAELALRRERDGAEYRAALGAIARETARLEGLIDELLAAARTQVDAAAPRSLDASDLARRVGDRVHPAAAVRDVLVEVDVPERAPARADAATVERALMAIVHNAIAYAPERGRVRLKVATAADGVRIEVADDGPGFSPAGLQHATERFWRGDSARPRGGTGLGLAIARTMVEANGGTLTLANAAGGGARVTVKLAGYV